MIYQLLISVDIPDIKIDLRDKITGKSQESIYRIVNHLRENSKTVGSMVTTLINKNVDGKTEAMNVIGQHVECEGN